MYHCVKSVRIRNFSRSVFSRIRTEYGPEKLRIRTLFTLCILEAYLEPYRISLMDVFCENS